MFIFYVSAVISYLLLLFLSYRKDVVKEDKTNIDLYTFHEHCLDQFKGDDYFYFKVVLSMMVSAKFHTLFLLCSTVLIKSSKDILTSCNKLDYLVSISTFQKLKFTEIEI